jgi:hypothetical protein
MNDSMIDSLAKTFKKIVEDWEFWNVIIFVVALSIFPLLTIIWVLWKFYTNWED